MSDGQTDLFGVHSLDGYVADEKGNFDWAELDEEVHAHINERERRKGTYPFGRKLYETMIVWGTPEALIRPGPAELEYAPIWRAAEMIVYSTTLQAVSSARTRIKRKFKADAVREPRRVRKRTLKWAVLPSRPLPSGRPCGRIPPARRAGHFRRRQSLSAARGLRKARTSR